MLGKLLIVWETGSQFLVSVTSGSETFDRSRFVMLWVISTFTEEDFLRNYNFSEDVFFWPITISSVETAFCSVNLESFMTESTEQQITAYCSLFTGRVHKPTSKENAFAMHDEWRQQLWQNVF